MIVALLLQQVIRFQAPSAQPYTLRAMVPGMLPPLEVPNCPSDSRLVLTLEDGTPVSEVVARVPGNTTQVQVRAGVGASTPSLVQNLLTWVALPGRVSLRIDGHPFSITSPRHFVRWYRDGKVMPTAELHRTLGNYGQLEWWITARDQQLDFCLLWHRASAGPGVLFNKAELVVGSSGTSWVPTLPDPASSATYLVTPGDHILPQQCARVFWFSIRPDGGPVEPDRVGVADWSRGGFMPAGLPIPELQPGVDYGPALAAARYSLANLAPIPSWGGTPVEPLWPANGELFGGTGGGVDRVPLDGSRWAVSGGDPDALEFYRIELLRGLSRARVRLEGDGQPLRLQGLPRTWAFDTVFLANQDAPWNWHTYWNPWGGAHDPRIFADHDTFSMLRRLNECWTLVWLANEPVARLLTLEGATRALLTFEPLAPTPQAGIGTGAGGPAAVSALAIAAARCLGATQYEPWRAAFLAHYARAQMPSGCLVARLGGYPSELPPFDAYPNILLQGGAEFAYLQLALYSFGDRTTVRGCARGMLGLATDDDDPGYYYYTPTGNGSQRYFDENDWPVELHAQMGLPNESYYTAWDMGYSLALAFETGAPERFELLRRFTGSDDPATALAIMRGWGLQAPSSQTSAPYENYAELLGVLQ